MPKESMTSYLLVHKQSCIILQIQSNRRVFQNSKLNFERLTHDPFQKFVFVKFVLEDGKWAVFRKRSAEDKNDN